MSNVNERNLILTRAQNAVIAHDFVTAARLYKQLLKVDPSNVDYLRELGSIYVKNGEDAKAIPYYEQIITFYPHYVEAMNSLGAIYRRLKRYDESIAILQRALDEDRQTGSVNYNLGFTYKEMGHYDDAIEAFEIVVTENPSDVLAYNHLGKIYYEQQQYQKSIASYKKGLGVDKNHPILNYNLALCYDKAQMYPDAIRCFESALKAKPGWLDAIKDFSSLLIRCQKTKEASDIVTRSIELHPNDTKLLCLLGRIYLEQYDYCSAVKTFRRAEQVDGNDLQTLSGLAEALEKNEKPEEALDPVSKALEIAPDDMNIRKQYVHTLLSAEEYDAALVNVTELLAEIGKDDIELMDLFEQYYICTNNEEKAKEYSDKIIKQNKHYKDHLLSAADRYSQIGNEEKAEQKAKEFVAREIRNPAGYNMLGKIYERSGNYKGAIDYYDKSRNLKKPNILADKKISKLQDLLNSPAPEPVVETPIPEEFIPTEVPADETKVTEEIIGDDFITPENTDEFDFEQLGGNVPLEEALLEDETPFFEKLDDMTGEQELSSEEEAEVFAEDKKDPYEEKDPYGFGGGGSGFGEGSESDSTDVNAMGNGSGAGGAGIGSGYGNESGYGNGGNGYEDGSAAGTGAGNGYTDPDGFDFGQFDDASAQESGAYRNGPMQVPSREAAQAQYQEEMERKLQDAMMNSSNYAMETALNAQKIAQQLATEQDSLKTRVKNVEDVQSAMQQGLIPTGMNASGGTVEGDVYGAVEDAALNGDSVTAEEAILTSDGDTYSEEDGILASVDTEDYGSPMFGSEGDDAIYADALSQDETDALLGTPEELYDDKTNSSAEQLIPTIEKILADDDIASENSDKIELFKKLLMLSDFLPEEEKEAFLSGKTRMQMEYLIAKLSGKPGLLKTSQSLVKAGVFGDVNETVTVGEAGSISNHTLRKVINIMKKLSKDLEDQSLAQALCTTADNILEQIELEDKKSQIF